ncbi:uncharacterized protein RJT21DRAFT_129970 [Scheffersomyces amazonensis]|uniref:uncharacterized protein n=1 Tax=Scheffersomyces amazonensis TaxID=1078765 RepID=UPI00315D3659
MAIETHLYDILQVYPSATLEEISKSYKKLALKCHPDKTNRDPQLTEQFKELTRAYEVLRDDNSRKLYDDYGEAGLDSSFQPPIPTQNVQFRRNVPNPRAPFPNPTDIFSQVFNDINSMFSQQPVFDFGQSFMQDTNNVNMKKVVQPAGSALDQQVFISGQDIHHTCNVELGDLYYGKTIKLRLPKTCKCENCDGYGGFNPRTCRVCQGSGRVTITHYNQFSRFRRTGSCEPCNGTGTFVSPNDRCQVCNGQGYMKDSKILKIEVLPGTKDGDIIILKGEADEGRNIIPGDVIIHVKEVTHPYLVRKFNDLYMEHTIDLRTALLGGEIFIPNFLEPNQTLRVFINVHGYKDINNSIHSSLKYGEVVGTINSGDPKIVKGLGMPINHFINRNSYVQNPMEDDVVRKKKLDIDTYRKGNLFINFKVTLPSINEFVNGEQDLAALNNILPMSSLSETSNANLIGVKDSYLANISFSSKKRRPNDSMNTNNSFAATGGGGGGGGGGGPEILI